MRELTIRDDDDFQFAVIEDHWAFGMGPRDSDDEQDHPFAIVGRLMDFREYVPDNELEDEVRKFPIVCDFDIVPTNPCQQFIDKILGDYGMDDVPTDESHRLHFIIEAVLSEGGAVPCARDILGSRREGVDPFEGMVEDTDYIHYGGKVYFAEWDTACQFVKTHLPNVAQATGGLIGFTMDRAVNRMGTTGWDWVRPVVTGEEWLVFP